MSKKTDSTMKVLSPRYLQIATDIASKIVNGQYKVGDKIYARSYIASQYGVSSETARRAITILSDLEIVETIKGSGVIIKSRDKALEFVRQYNDIQTVKNLKNELLNSVERQQKEIKHFNDCLNKLIDNTDRFKAFNPFVPFDIPINKDTPLLGKTISEVNFWHNTSATIIAIKREKTLLMSPGPYATLLENDILYFVGDENALERVQTFLYSPLP